MDKTDKKKFITSFIFLLLFIVVLILFLSDKLTSFDTVIYDYIISFRNNEMDYIMKSITQFGNTVPVIIIILALMITLTKRKEVFLIGFNTILTVSSNQILKHIICRPRPDHIRLITEHGYSFPSGHSMIAVCLYGLLIYLINKKIKNKILRIIITIFLITLIIGIGISRIYVGVHYPSDVLGGYLLSLSILIFNITIVNKYYRGKKHEKGGNL